MQTLNAQTCRLQTALQRGEPLVTRRGAVLGQLIFCEGCCCGQTDRGFPPLPKERIKAVWKSKKLNQAIQLTISGCLGPCDLANVVAIVQADGRWQWLGGLSEDWQYDMLIEWAEACQGTGRFQPLPERLTPHLFSRFDRPRSCQSDLRCPEERSRHGG
jgi:predicted metal-binding protein